MERNIPHVRDIFGGRPADDKLQEVRVYEYSPRSRRRRDFLDDHKEPLLVNSCHADKRREQKKNRPLLANGDDFPRGEKERNAANKHRNGRDEPHYSTRTLTDRDIRHLERHLSMKKTIRKQISRNLAQAFVEDPLLLQQAEEEVRPTPAKVTNDRIFTLTKAKVSKSEQNVLELLKDAPEDTDSGHCSPVHHGSSDDDVAVQEDSEPRSTRHGTKADNDAKYRKEPSNSESKFSSFWKMFSVKGKGKRYV